MKKTTLIFLMLCLLLSIVNALAWETPCTGESFDYQFEDEARSIHIKGYQEDNLHYFVADVQLAQADSFRTALSHNKPGGCMEALSDIASRVGAVLAINGDDYGAHKYGLIIRNGELLRARNTTRNLLTVDSAGDMAVKVDRKNEKSKALAKELLAQGIRQGFEFGPELVRDGQAVSFSKAFDVISTSSSRLEPRTAIGQIGPLHYVIIVVDGRQEGYSLGISLQNLQQLFLRFGAQTAMNLDGGGSSELWFMGQVINRPSGGAERQVSDIIWF